MGLFHKEKNSTPKVDTSFQQSVGGTPKENWVENKLGVIASVIGEVVQEEDSRKRKELEKQLKVHIIEFKNSVHLDSRRFDSAIKSLRKSLEEEWNLIITTKKKKEKLITKLVKKGFSEDEAVLYSELAAGSVLTDAWVDYEYAKKIFFDTLQIEIPVVISSSIKEANNHSKEFNLKLIQNKDFIKSINSSLNAKKGLFG